MTLSLIPSVRLFVPFFSFCVFGVLKLFLVQGSVKGVLRKFQGRFKISRVFQGSFKGVSRKFQGCFIKEVGSVKDI